MATSQPRGLQKISLIIKDIDIAFQSSLGAIDHL
jgi:hypothetical protein